MVSFDWLLWQDQVTGMASADWLYSLILRIAVLKKVLLSPGLLLLVKRGHYAGSKNEQVHCWKKSDEILPSAINCAKLDDSIMCIMYIQSTFIC
jgi:hypothetical protein